MSLLTKARGSAPAFAQQAPEIAIKLQAARDRLSALESRHDDLALDKLLGVDGAASALDKLVRDIATAKAELATLQGAHSAAEKRDAEVIRAQRASLYATQFRTVKANLDKRDAAATALSAAVAEAIKAWTVLVTCSQKANAATPLGTSWPDGGIFARSELQRLVGAELYRHDGGDAMLGNKFSFPGAAVELLDHQGRPDVIVPLADKLKQNSAWIVATLTGKEPK